MKNPTIKNNCNYDEWWQHWNLPTQSLVGKHTSQTPWVLISLRKSFPTGTLLLQKLHVQPVWRNYLRFLLFNWTCRMHFVTLCGASPPSTSRLMNNRNRFPVLQCSAIDHPENVPRSVWQAAHSIAPLQSICIFESKYIVHSGRKPNFSGKTRTLHSINWGNLIKNVGYLLQYTPSLEYNSIKYLSPHLSNFVSDYSGLYCDHSLVQVENGELCD